MGGGVGGGGSGPPHTPASPTSPQASVQRIVSATCNGHAVTATASEDCTVQVTTARGVEVHTHQDYVYGLALCAARARGKAGGDATTVGLATGGWDGVVSLIDLGL